jgi:hypothetical protein
MCSVQDVEEQVRRHAEVDQEVNVQPDGVCGYEGLLANDCTNEATRARNRSVIGEKVRLSLSVPDY